MRPIGPSSPVINVWPWENGAHNWPSMLFSPKTGLVADRVETWTGYSDVIGRDRTASKAGDDTFRQGAWLKAWNPLTNREVWRAEQPGLWAGGTLTTSGGLVFIGLANGDLAAFDASYTMSGLGVSRPTESLPRSQRRNRTLAS